MWLKQVMPEIKYKGENRVITLDRPRLFMEKLQIIQLNLLIVPFYAKNTRQKERSPISILRTGMDL